MNPFSVGNSTQNIDIGGGFATAAKSKRELIFGSSYKTSQTDHSDKYIKAMTEV